VALIEHLEPILDKKGFYKFRKYLYVRVRGDIISVLTMKRVGKRVIKLHCFCNLLPSNDPKSTLKHYDVGKGYTCNDKDDVAWISTDVENTQKTIYSMIELIQREVFDWFDSIKMIEDYIVEYMNSQLDDIWTYDEKLESYFALIGKEYLASYLKMENKFSYSKGNKEKLYALIASTKDKEIDQEYVARLRDDNINFK